MVLPLPVWLRGRRGHRNGPFTRAVRGNLDITMPPPYDMDDEPQVAARARIEDFVRRLSPGGIDAGTRDALNNLVNAWLDQAVARLDAVRDERQAVAEVLIGLAREEVARREPAYVADLTRVAQTREALGATFQALTGKSAAALGAPVRPAVQQPLRSVLGPVDLTDTWVRTRQPGPPVPADQPGPDTRRTGPGVAAHSNGHGPPAQGGATGAAHLELELP